MYPFNINSTQNPISFDSQSYQHKPLFNNFNYTYNYPINSEFDNFPLPNSFFHLPSPQQYEKDEVFELTWQQLHDLFFHQSSETSNYMENLKRVDNNDNDDDDNNDNEQIKQINTTTTTTPRKRSSKKDRHSKITTASGLRDRRMRLSLPVARKFFGLQDMLGFDKASKTIEWLLTQSTSAIQQTSMKFHNQQQQPQGITHASSSFSSTSECISGNIAESNYNAQPKIGVVKPKSSCNEKKNATNGRGTAFAKESRKFARERARKRTIEKRKIDSESFGGQYFGATTAVAAEEESGTQNASKIISPVLPLQEIQYLSSLVISSNLNTSGDLYNFDQNEDIFIQQQEYGSSLWY